MLLVFHTITYSDESIIAVSDFAWEVCNGVVMFLNDNLISMQPELAFEG